MPRTQLWEPSTLSSQAWDWPRPGCSGVVVPRWRRLQQDHMFRTNLELSRLSDQARSSTADEVGQLLVGVAHPQLPAVVVVENLHLMGAEFGELIDYISTPRSECPLLVLATAWPEGRGNDQYAHWLTRAQQRGSVQVIEMPQLDPESLIQLLLRSAPTTEAADASRVVAHYATRLRFNFSCLWKEWRDALPRMGVPCA